MEVSSRNSGMTTDLSEEVVLACPCCTSSTYDGECNSVWRKYKLKTHKIAKISVQYGEFITGVNKFSTRVMLTMKRIYNQPLASDQK
jgi:tellurite resistance protein